MIIHHIKEFEIKSLNFSIPISGKSFSEGVQNRSFEPEKFYYINFIILLYLFLYRKHFVLYRKHFVLLQKSFGV